MASVLPAANPLDDAAREFLRCPVTEGPLSLTDAGDLVSGDGTRSYRVWRGVPIMFVPERTLFAFEAEPVDRSPARAGMAQRGRAALARLVPPVTRNVAGAENFREVARLLDEGRDAGVRRRVLVIGGGVEGAGISELIDRPWVDAVETDVFVGPRTQVVCDAHDLPFRDGTFDAVVSQAMLNNVLDPARVVSEIHRVLRPGGIVYSETAFLQPVYMGRYDNLRLTQVGHRLLFRWFDEVRSGVQCGPGSALAWTFVSCAVAVAGRSRVLRLAARAGAPFLVFWLPRLDPWLVQSPGATDAASGTFLIGRRRQSPLPDRDILGSYRGVVDTAWTRDRSEEDARARA